jgi:hypothetical protein
MNQERTPPTADENWTLLYSTLGYETCAPKQIWLRALTGQRLSPSAIWTLWREGSGEIMCGQFSPGGSIQGDALWYADFECRAPGRYRILVTELEAGKDTTLSTLPFRVAHDLYWQETVNGMALEGASVRQAPAFMGGGYFDTNRAPGLVVNHALYAVGLMQSLLRRQESLNALERAQLIWALDRAIDYVIALVDKAGAIRPQARFRRFASGSDTQATQYGLWALAMYADIFRGTSMRRARRACRLSLRVQRHLREMGSPHYPPELAATVNGSLWWHTGDPLFLERGLEGLQMALTRQKGKSSLDYLPRYEALYWFAKHLPNDSRVAAILETTKHRLMPAREKLATLADLEAVSVFVPGGQPDGCRYFANGPLLRTAIDCLYLAQLYGEPSLAKAATANLAWVSGLHPGIPGKLVENPASTCGLEAAAFIRGVAARRAKTWDTWFWEEASERRPMTRCLLRLCGIRQRPPAVTFTSLIRGFRTDGTFDDEPETAEVSLGDDGLWLYAACMHGDYYDEMERVDGQELSAGAEL